MCHLPQQYLYHHEIKRGHVPMETVTITRLGVQLVVATVCAGIAYTLIPRRIPGHIVGLMLLGLFGVWVGEWLLDYLGQMYNLRQFAFLYWDVQQVRILPAIVGCTLVMYLLKLFLQWGRYER
ncbi:MAG: GlsB/YeaQ/YmgE family stress response membrane protein [Leptolyngbyaceae cyanobacterium]